MSKRKQLSGKAKQRTATQGSIYDTEGLKLGDDFFEELRSSSDERVKELENSLRSALVPHEDGVMSIGPFRLHRTYLEVVSDITEDDADLLGQLLVETDRRLQFVMGDWANLYIDDDMDSNRRGDVYTSLSERFGIEHKTLNNYASICRILGVSRRRETLSFSHHAEIAHLPADLKGQEEELLDAAVENKWSVRDLRNAIRQQSSIIEDDLEVLQTVIEKSPFETTPPNLNSVKVRKWWAKAVHGDKNARERINTVIADTELWLSRLKDSLDD